MTTITSLLDEIEIAGYRLDMLRQLDAFQWYASLRRGSDIVFTVSADAYGTTPLEALHSALVAAKSQEAA
jgi:hypothetical protein